MTEFVLRLHPQRRTVFAGILAYPLPSIPEAVETAGNFWDQALSEKEAIFYAQTPRSQWKCAHFRLVFITTR